MATNKNDNWNITAPKAIDQRTGKFVAGVWQPFASVAEANSTITQRHKSLTVSVLSGSELVEYWYKDGITDSDLILKIPKDRAYANVAALSGTSDNFPAGTIVTTRGYTASNDGGGAQYIISDTPLSGVVSGSPAQILLSSGKYAILYHQGTVLLSQFGAVGNGSTNDMNAFTYANNLAAVDNKLSTILGKSDATYLLRKQARALPNTGGRVFTVDCFLYIGYSGVTWDGLGSKIIFDNNATQSYVYYQSGGVWNVYRAKHSSVGQVPNNAMYWENYYWQIMQSNVTPNGTYPTWNSGTQYYGAQNFINMGTEGNYVPGTVTKDINFQNWEINGNETQSNSINDGYWNVYAKTICTVEGVEDITFRNIFFKNTISEVVYGGGFQYVKNVNVLDSTFEYVHNAISHGGSMRVANNTFNYIGANAVESFSAIGDKQYYVNNKISNAHNGITVGGPGNDIDVQGDVVIDANEIFNCDVYGVFVAGKIRGLRITNNQVFDCPSGLISLYSLSLSFPSVNSEIAINNNILGCYRTNVNVAILFNSSHGDSTKLTNNILISNNFVGPFENTYIEAINATIGSFIQFNGDKYGSNVLITSNNVGRGLVGRNIDYVGNSTSWLPRLVNNTYMNQHVIQKIAVNNSDYNNPVNIIWSDVASDFQPLYFDDYGSSRAVFLRTPTTTAFPLGTFKGFTMSSTNGLSVVIMPSTDGSDDLVRSRLAYSVSGARYLGSLELVDTQLSGLEGFFKSFRWVFSRKMLQLPTVYTVQVALSGVLNSGATNFAVGAPQQIGVNLNVNTPGTPQYHTYINDPSVANKISDVAGVTLRAVSSGINIQFYLDNASGTNVDLTGKFAAIRLYPFGNITYLPNNIQPLRSEGLTNMIPENRGDVPNRFAYWNTQTNQRLEYDLATNTWAVPSSGGGSGSGATKTTATFTGSNTVAIPAGADLLSIRVNPTTTLTGFKVGTTSGADDVINTQTVPSGWVTFNINVFFPSATTLYVQGITSSTVITTITI